MRSLTPTFEFIAPALGARRRSTVISACSLLCCAGAAHAQMPDVIWTDTLDTAGVTALDYSPDGSRLVVSNGFFNCGGKGGNTDCAGQGGFTVFEALNGGMIYSRMPFGDGPEDVAYSPDGGIIAIAANFDDVQLRDAADGSLIATLPVDLGGLAIPSSLDFTNDGGELFVGLRGGFDEGLNVYSVPRQTFMMAYDLIEDGVGALAISPNGEMVAIAQYPHIYVFSTTNQYSLITVIQRPHIELASSPGSYDLAFSPDNASLASIGLPNAKLFNLATGEVEQVFNFPTSNEEGWSIAFAPNGASIVTGGLRASSGVRGSINVFDVATGEAVAHYDESTGRVVQDIDYAPDGSAIAFVSDSAGSGGGVVAAIENPLFEELRLGDMDGDGAVNLFDLLYLLDAWGPCDGACGADLNGDDVTNVHDLLMMLAAWG